MVLFFFGIATVAVLFFIITLILYKQEKKKLSLSPESVDPEKLKKLKTALSASGAVAGVSLGIAIIRFFFMLFGSDTIYFFGIPVIAVLSFIIILILYKLEKKKLSLSLESVDPEKLKKLKTALSASGAIAGVLFGTAFIICVLLLFFLPGM